VEKRSIEHTIGHEAAGDVTLDGRGTYDERLNHILASATDTFARLGYEKASMREVAKAAGVSLAGVYHYFDGKERILFLIQFRAFGSLLNNLREKLSGVEDAKKQLCVMIRAHLGYFAANMSALKVCSHELDSLSGAAYEDTRKIRHEYYELCRDIVDRVLNEHDVNGTMDRHVATMALFGTLNWLYRWYDPKRGPAVSTVARQIADQYLVGLVGAAMKQNETS
jgi:TetR/AcrR family transcriptional regulator, cholesterol catabolism regulator